VTNDLQIIKSHYGVEIFDVEDRTASSVTTTLKPGEPVKRALFTSIHSPIPLATGDAEEGVDIWLGIVKEESTETSSVDGKVNVELVGPGTVIKGRATTPANINTAALFLAVQGDYVCFDVTASTGTNGIFTIDEDEGDDPNVHTGMIQSSSDWAAGYINMLVAHATTFYSTV
jgi:hypothetical protein